MTEASNTPPDLYRDRLTALIAKWETAAREETDEGTFHDGYLSGQNWAASELRELLWQVECAEHAAKVSAAISDGRF